MKKLLQNFLLFIIALPTKAQTVQVQVDILANRKPVSPFIYGRNNNISDDAGNPISASTWQLYKDAGLNFFRENGGNNLTKYNWRLKLSSHPDWYNNVYSHDWDFAATSLHQNIPTAQGMWGFQLIGKAASNTANNFNDWGYNQSQWWSGVAQNLAGGGVPNNAGGSQATVQGNPNLYLENWPADSTAGVLTHWFGSGGIGLDSTKIRYWNMDNEVEIWNSTHDDVMPTQPSAEAFMQLYFAVAKKARALYPGIKLTGPVSPNEWQWFNWNNTPVTGSDGKQYPWIKYFIKRVAEEEQATGIRLLDVIDLHFYPGSSAASDVVQYHRVFFDSTYAFPEANGVKVVNGGWDNSIQIEDVFGRCQNWLNQYMGPNNGVTFAISETAVNLQNNPNALAIWYASTLGEFMNRGVEYFSPWSWDFGMWEVLHLYSRYNKTNSVLATSNNEQNLSAYATVNNTNDSMTVVLVNRSLTQTESVTLNFNNFSLATGPFSTKKLSGLPVGTETFISHTNNALQTSTISPSANSLQVSVAPLSIVSLQLTGQASGALPLTLSSFTASKAGSAVRLDFSTVQEHHTSTFEIERSADGSKFALIGTVKAANNSIAANKYFFYDNSPLPSLNYYRLKLIDVDGKSGFSKVVALRFTSNNSFEVLANPAAAMLNIQLNMPVGPVNVQLFDATGRLLKSLVLNATGNTMSTSIDISAFQKGLYYVTAAGQTRSFIKQ